MTTHTHYQETDLDDVLRYYANGFTPDPGETIIKVETFIDITKNKVLFKMLVEEKEKTES